MPVVAIMCMKGRLRPAIECLAHLRIDGCLTAVTQRHGLPAPNTCQENVMRRLSSNHRNLRTLTVRRDEDVIAGDKSRAMGLTNGSLLDNELSLPSLHVEVPPLQL